MSILFGAKHFGFFEIYGVLSARTKGVELVQTFCGQARRGNFFAILCGRLLWTAPSVIPVNVKAMNFIVPYNNANIVYYTVHQNTIVSLLLATKTGYLTFFIDSC